MKDISSTEHANPAYSSIFTIYTSNVSNPYDQKKREADLVIGIVLDGMEVVKNITLRHLIKRPTYKKLTKPDYIDKPPNMTLI